jgi:hypothetical protein
MRMTRIHTYYKQRQEVFKNTGILLFQQKEY